MKLAALPPVRRAVPFRRGSPTERHAVEQFFGDRKIALYPSGTAALAEAITQCAARRQVRAPEVIIPAYGCPDLVAACAYASAYPRLVDVASSHWAYDREALRSSLSDNTIAIVAVNLLGIGDSSAELTAICKAKKIALIQDSAQFLPRHPIEWPGDYVVLSFGRGKPLNLLHGGALIFPANRDVAVPTQPARYAPKDRILASWTAAAAFNFLTRPLPYGLLSSLPRTGLGQVVYKPISNCAPLPTRAWTRVGAAFERYRKEQSYSSTRWAPFVEAWADMGLEPLVSSDSVLQLEPLRLTLLAPGRIARDTLVAHLNKNGLGASHFYGADLPRISGIPDFVKLQGPVPQASTLADRLFTLPTHDLVTAATIQRTRDIVSQWHRSLSAQRTPSIGDPNLRRT